MRILLFLIFSISAVVIFKKEAGAHDELVHQVALCSGMEMEIFIPESGTKVDCVSNTHAIEVDFSNKWAAAIGQSLHYASMLEKKPGIVLICKKTTTEKTCVKHSYLVEQSLSHWNIEATMWLCKHRMHNLEECSRV